LFWGGLYGTQKKEPSISGGEKGELRIGGTSPAREKGKKIILYKSLGNSDDHDAFWTYSRRTGFWKRAIPPW